jgi:hypothetical protein
MRYVTALLALLSSLTLMPAPVAAQGTPIGCTSFSGFPLQIQLGQRIGAAIVGSESPLCANTKIMAAINAMAGQRGAANGIATLGPNGLLPDTQAPASFAAFVSQKGAASGLAVLDLTSRIPAGQMPTAPAFLAATSPNGTDAYGSGFSTGQAAVSGVSTDSSTVTGKERYAAAFGYAGPGTGDPSVIGTSVGLGAFAVKQNWQSTTVKGQAVGLNITSRGGYFGADANSAPPEFNGYNPAGDTSGIVTNTVQASDYGQNAALESVIFYAPGGAFGNAVKSMNVQLGPMRQKNPDGSVANPGIGVALSANNGALGYAVQANNTARSGSYAYQPGSWGGFLRYNRDDGTNAPYDAYTVEQDGMACWRSATGAAPRKCIRANANDTLQVLNNAGVVSQQFGSNGSLYLTDGQLVIQGLPVVGPRQAAISDSLTDSQKITAVLTALRAHGLIGQ